jgi:hypothetical protein
MYNIFFSLIINNIDVIATKNNTKIKMIDMILINVPNKM